jgi:5'(3')-deoxyribonucleotidase
MDNKIGTATPTRKKILIDMDGVLADFTGKVFETFRERYGDPKLDPAKQEQFYVADYFNQHLGEKAKKQVEEIQSEIGFFLSLNPLPYAKEKIKELSQWYDTYILTSPLGSNPSCASEKIQRIRQHL